MILIKVKNAIWKYLMIQIIIDEEENNWIKKKKI